VDVYHVHRTVLAIGRRRSAYFANLFHYDVDDDGGGHCTRVELSGGAAEHFPDLLDYVYSSQAFAVTARNAVALLFLARAFQVQSLQIEVQDFIESDVRLDNFGLYLSEALYFAEEGVAHMVMDRCGREILLRMGSDPTLLSRTLMYPPLLSATFTCLDEKIEAAWGNLRRLHRTVLPPRGLIGDLAAWRRERSANKKRARGHTYAKQQE
jgi:hypothetical protein